MFDFLETGEDIRDMSAVYEEGIDPMFVRPEHPLPDRICDLEEFNDLLVQEFFSDSVTAKYPELGSNEELREYDEKTMRGNIDMLLLKERDTVDFLHYDLDLRPSAQELEDRKLVMANIKEEELEDWSYRDYAFVDSILRAVRTAEHNKDKTVEIERERELQKQHEYLMRHGRSHDYEPQY